MSSLLIRYQGCLTNALRQAYPAMSNDAKLLYSKDSDLYSWAGGLKIAKHLKLDVADVNTNIVKNLDVPGGEVSISKGLIMIGTKVDAIARELDRMHRDPRQGVPLTPERKRVIVEFSSPNIAKELHVGHLRSTIIGESLARLMEFVGHDVLRLSHIGDWGTQFGMLLHYFKVEKIDGGKLSLAELLDCYKKSKKLFDNDEEFKERSRLAVVALQGGDKEALRTWNQICDVSRRGYEEIYRLLDITVTERGESYYNDMLESIVKDLMDRKVGVVNEGAKVVFIPGEKVPFMLQKSDGGYGYDTTDLAAVKQRYEVEKAQRVIYVVDSGQSLHFSSLYKVGAMAGYYDPAKSTFEHVGFGLVLGADGKKFKTRSGDTVLLRDLLDSAIEKAKEVYKEKEKERLEKGGSSSDDTAVYSERSAITLGIGALKYADMKNPRLNDYAFDPDKMLSFEGNTVCYILYALVRIKTIFRQAAKEAGMEPFALVKPEEVALGFHLTRFNEVIDLMEATLEPHHMCSYLYDLAVRFNGFYRACQVVGSPEEQARLRLCDITAKVQERGLYLLGIRTLDKM